MTVAEAVAEPPLPVQVTEYTIVALGDTDNEPERPLGEKFTPVHDVALVLPHVSVEDCPT